MLRTKKTVLTLLTLANTTAFAGLMGPVCSAVNSTVPCAETAWHVAGKALYLKPSFDTTANFAIEAPPEYNAKTKDNWGFQLEGAYHFNTGNDVNLNWYHLGGSGDHPLGITPSHIVSLRNGTVTQFGLNGTSQLNGQWDAVNLEVGQLVNFDSKKAIRFHGGAQYVRLTNNVDLDYQASLTNVSSGTQIDQRTVHSEKEYNGFGARVGMDLLYGWTSGVTVYAKTATALLAGTGSNNRSFTSISTTTAQDALNESNTVVTPELEAKLGIDYTYSVARGDLTLDAGWMWINYFSVFADSAIDNGGKRTDFGLQGLYFGLKWLSKDA